MKATAWMTEGDGWICGLVDYWIGDFLAPDLCRASAILPFPESSYPTIQFSIHPSIHFNPF